MTSSVRLKARRIGDLTLYEEENMENKLIGFEEAKKRLALAPKDPVPPGGNWLSQLEQGSEFLVIDRRNPTDFVLGLFKLLKHESDRTVVLFTPQMQLPVYVDPVRFCGKYSLHENLGTTVEPEEEKEEKTDTTIDNSKL